MRRTGDDSFRARGPDRSAPDAATGKGPEQPAPGDLGGHERVRDEVTRPRGYDGDDGCALSEVRAAVGAPPERARQPDDDSEVRDGRRDTGAGGDGERLVVWAL